MNYSIYLFPHQDDEMFVFQSLQRDLEQEIVPLIFFLTCQSDFALNHSRNQESLEVLVGLNVKRENIFFIGEKLSVQDTKLTFHLTDIFSEVLEVIGEHKVQSIYTTAYEGGHPDHDSTALIAYKLSQTLVNQPQVFEFWCYQGNKTPGKFFRVRSPFRPDVTQTFSLRLKYLSWILKAPLFYPSQKMSWLGLYPGFLIKSLFTPLKLTTLKKEVLRDAPHSGSLLYERWDRMSYIEFKKEKEKFLSL